MPLFLVPPDLLVFTMRGAHSLNPWEGLQSPPEAEDSRPPLAGGVLTCLLLPESPHSSFSGFFDPTQALASQIGWELVSLSQLSVPREGGGILWPCWLKSGSESGSWDEGVYKGEYKDDVSTRNPQE